MSDEELVSGCLKKNPLAQKQLWERFSRKMMGVCLRYSNDKDDAEDILQVGFIKVFENIESFKGSGSLEGWVRRIMVNTALNHYRQNKQSRESLDIEVVDYMVEGDNQVSDRLDAKELMRMIQKLPPGFRSVFNLFAIEGYSHREIAEMLEISEGTSKSQYARARMYLQRMILKEEKSIEY
ncbi:MAG: RNA polymerase sigma factor [Bacteroidia bacterium]|nr:RNA polymerase sigma factor [Bacteroidia bacterium]